jgi:hypothetical protein
MTMTRKEISNFLTKSLISDCGKSRAARLQHAVRLIRPTEWENFRITALGSMELSTIATSSLELQNHKLGTHLRSDLVSALTDLQVNDFPHDD